MKNPPLFLKRPLSQEVFFGAIALALVFASGAVLFFSDGRGATQLGALSVSTGSAPSQGKSKGPEGVVSEETKQQPKIRLHGQPAKGQPFKAEPAKSNLLQPGTPPPISSKPSSFVPPFPSRQALAALLPPLQNLPFVSLLSSFIPSAGAQGDWCLGYPTGLLSDWCTTEKLNPYFGASADEAVRISYRESGRCNPNAINPTGCNGNGCVGLFQIDRNYCGNSYGLSADRGDCTQQLLIPQCNIDVASHIRSAWQGWRAWQSAGPTYCNVLGDVGPLSVSGSTLPLPSCVTQSLAVPPSIQTPPPASSPGAIRGQKLSDVFPQGTTQRVWLDGGSPNTTGNPFNFTSIGAGNHTIHTGIFYYNGQPMKPQYTLCSSDQPGCGAAGDPNRYHWLNNLKIPRYYPSATNATEAVVDVSVPSGGFVDFWWHFPPLTLPGGLESSYPPPPDTIRSVNNLPSCANGLYGGSQYFGGSPNINVDFTVYNATMAEAEAYQNGSRFFDYQWSNLTPNTAYRLNTYFWNLSAYEGYYWRARSGNAAGWGDWTIGYPWYETSCTAPPNPSNFQAPTNLLSCSDTSYSNVGTSFAISRTTKVEARLLANGTQVWSNEGNGFNADPSWTSFGITWSNLSPEATYSYQVRAANERGWSSWKDGPSWKVGFCTPPPLPTVFQPRNVPECSNTTYDNVVTEFQVSRATTAEYEFYADGTKIKNSIQNDGLWLSLDPASIHTLSYNWVRLLPDENYTWRARAKNSAGWSGWAWGNSIYAPFCIALAPPNLSAEAMAAGTISNLAPGQTLDFGGRLRNMGGSTDRAFNIEWRMNGVGFLRTKHAAMGAGVSDPWAHDQASYTFNTVGTFDVQLCADVTNVIAESSETDNCSSPWRVNVTSNVTELYAYGLWFSDPVNGKAEETDFEPGSAIEAVFSIFNEGNIPVSNFWIDFWPADPLASSGICNGGGDLSVPWFFDGTLQPGEKLSDIAIPFTAPSTLNQYQGFVYVDSRCFIPEPSATDTNNKVLNSYNVVASVDGDEDGFRNSHELFMGTYPASYCPQTSTLNDEPTDAWPPDFNDSQKVDGFDVFLFAQRYGTQEGIPPPTNKLPYLSRFDLDTRDAARKIDGNDLYVLAQYFNTTCINGPVSPHSASVLSGTVTDQNTQEPVSNASVSYTASPTTSATADSRGNYYFLNPPVKRITVEVSAPGYQPMKKKITIESDKATIVHLKLKKE